jgi:hypothetical protein
MQNTYDTKYNFVNYYRRNGVSIAVIPELFMGYYAFNEWDNTSLGKHIASTMKILDSKATGIYFYKMMEDGRNEIKLLQMLKLLKRFGKSYPGGTVIFTECPVCDKLASTGPYALCEAILPHMYDDYGCNSCYH